MLATIRRASSLLSNFELRSYVKPELGELQIGLARFVHVRVARPFETFVRHDTVLRSRELSFGEPPRSRLIACAILEHRHPRLVFSLGQILIANCVRARAYWGG